MGLNTLKAALRPLLTSKIIIVPLFRFLYLLKIYKKKWTSTEDECINTYCRTIELVSWTDCSFDLYIPKRVVIVLGYWYNNSRKEITSLAGHNKRKGIVGGDASRCFIITLQNLYFPIKSSCENWARDFSFKRIFLFLISLTCIHCLFLFLLFLTFNF